MCFKQIKNRNITLCCCCNADDRMFAIKRLWWSTLPTKKIPIFSSLPLLSCRRFTSLSFREADAEMLWQQIQFWGQIQFSAKALSQTPQQFEINGNIKEDGHSLIKNSTQNRQSCANTKFTSTFDNLGSAVYLYLYLYFCMCNFVFVYL